MKYIGTYSNSADIATKANVDAKQDKINVDGILMGDGTGAISAADKIEVELVELTKADVGLGNVDNTSDADKPISNATQTALNGKVTKVVAKDASVSVDSTTVTQPKVGVQISATANNNLELNSDGLYSGEEVLIVHLSGTTASLSADKTYAQITAAMKANRVCAVVVDPALQITGANIVPGTILTGTTITVDSGSTYKFSVVQSGTSNTMGTLTATVTSGNVWTISFDGISSPMIVTFTANTSGSYSASNTAFEIYTAYSVGRTIYAAYPEESPGVYLPLNSMSRVSDTSIAISFCSVLGDKYKTVAYKVFNTLSAPTEWTAQQVNNGDLIVTFSGTSAFTSSVDKATIYSAFTSGKNVVCKFPQNTSVIGRLVLATRSGSGANDYTLRFESRVIFDTLAVAPATNYIIYTTTGSSTWTTNIVSSPIMSSTGGGVMSAGNNRVTGVSNPANDTDAVNKQSLLSLIYPVGSIYMSVNAANPQTFLGGTWEQIKDTFLLAAGTTYTAGATGGEATHTLTVDEMPKHTHNIKLGNDTSAATYRVARYIDVKSAWWSGTGNDKMTEEVGGNAAHNNMPPYLAVYMWKRTE